jgi:hypothetical protein
LDDPLQIWSFSGLCYRSATPRDAAVELLATKAWMNATRSVSTLAGRSSRKSGDQSNTRDSCCRGARSTSEVLLTGGPSAANPSGIRGQVTRTLAFLELQGWGVCCSFAPTATRQVCPKNRTLIINCDCSAIAGCRKLVRVTPDVQANFCRRRHQPRRHLLNYGERYCGRLRNWPRYWIRARICRSRGYFLSASSSSKEAARASLKSTLTLCWVDSPNASTDTDRGKLRLSKPSGPIKQRTAGPAPH